MRSVRSASQALTGFEWWARKLSRIRKTFFAADQRLEKFDQLVRVEGAIDDHPARLALIGHGRDHRQLLPGSWRQSDGCFSFRSVAASTAMRVRQRRFIAPMDFAALRFGALGDGRIVLLEPRFHRLGASLIGAPDRFLGREAPTLQIFADAADR